MTTGEIHSTEDLRYETFRKKELVVVIVSFSLFLLSSAFVGLSPHNFLELPKMTKLFEFPNISLLPRLLQASLETLAIAYVSTFMAAIVSLFLGILAAKNLTPHVTVYYIARTVIMIARTIPDIIWGLLLIAAVGLGAVQGVFTIAIHSTGMLGRFFAKAIEEIDPRPLEALEIAGASYSQKIVYGIIPQVLPAYVNYTLYTFDHNVRAAIVLGMFGIGGLGFEFLLKLRMFEYDDVFAILLAIFVLLFAVERLSAYIRSKVMG